jgi:hypothetical protein
MARPRHQRCTVCGVVTSRYSHTETRGPFAMKVWKRDERNGSVQGADGKPYCIAHIDAAEAATPPPVVPVAEAALRRAANDPQLDDDTFAVLSRALRGVAPIA